MGHGEHIDAIGHAPKCLQPPLIHGLSPARLFLSTFPNGLSRQLVTALVFLVTPVPPNPYPFYLMGFSQFQERLPQVFVQDRFLLGIYPVLLDPSMDPFGHSFHHVIGIRHDLYSRRPLDLTQAFYDSGQLHSVVGRPPVTPGDFLDRFAVLQDSAVAPGTRVSATGTICEDLHNLVFLIAHGLENGLSGGRFFQVLVQSLLKTGILFLRVFFSRKLGREKYCLHFFGS
jgi:hypothetical protein